MQIESEAYEDMSCWCHIPLHGNWTSLFLTHYFPHYCLFDIVLYTTRKRRKRRLAPCTNLKIVKIGHSVLYFRATDL